MTRGLPSPDQLMHSAANMLETGSSAYAAYRAAIMEVLEVPLSSGFASGIHSSDIADPTSSVALASSRLFWANKLAEVEAQAVEAHAAAKNLLTMMSLFKLLAVDAKEMALGRCSDPLCDVESVAKGLCYRHWKAARRATLKEGVS